MYSKIGLKPILFLRYGILCLGWPHPFCSAGSQLASRMSRCIVLVFIISRVINICSRVCLTSSVPLQATTTMLLVVFVSYLARMSSSHLSTVFASSVATMICSEKFTRRWSFHVPYCNSRLERSFIILAYCNEHQLSFIYHWSTRVLQRGF